MISSMGASESFLPAAPDALLLRARLLGEPGIREVAIRRRRTLSGAVVDLAYLAADMPPDAQRLRRWREASRQAVILVPLTALPRRVDGHIDEVMLAAVPVLADDAVARLQSRGTAAAIAPRLLHANVQAAPAVDAPPAILVGETLLPDSLARATLSDALACTVHRFGQHRIGFVGTGEAVEWLTYADLYAAASCCAAGLLHAGVQARDPLLIQLRAPRAFITAVWGALLAGIRPVPLGIPLRLDAEDAVAQRLRDASALFPRARILSDQEETATIDQFIGAERALSMATLGGDGVAAAAALVEPGEPALYMLTSGSTAQPKVVPLSHRQILAHCRAVIAMHGVRAEDLSLNWLPLDHVGGIVMIHFRDVFAGANQLHVAATAILQDPLRWLDWCSRLKVTVTWAPNFAFGLVATEAARASDRSWRLEHLRIIINGGEAIVRAQAEAFVAALQPHGLDPRAMRPAWGMSETSSDSVVCSDFHGHMAERRVGPVSLGRPVPGNRLRIVNTAGVIVAEGCTGHLQVSGATVFDGYHENDAANRKAFTADGWFDTGDTGFVEDGCLYLVGRSKDVVIANGQNIDPSAIEGRIGGIEGVLSASTAVAAVRDPDDPTDQVAVFFAPHDQHVVLEGVFQAIRMVLASGFGVSPLHIVAIAATQIPRTSIGKIQKERLLQGLADGSLRPLRHEKKRGRHAATDAASRPEVWQRQWLRRAVTPGSLTKPVIVVARTADQAHPVAAGLRNAGVAALAIDLAGLRDGAALAGAECVLGLLETDGASRQLVALSQVCGPESRKRPLLLVAVARGAQKLGPADTVVLDGAASVPILRTAAREFPKLICRHVDLDGPAEDAAIWLAAECSDWSREPEVAYRDGARFVPRLGKPSRPRNQPLRIKGHYVVAGGLGGIGLLLCRHLIDRYEAKLVILGRRPAESLPETARTNLQHWLRDGRADYRALDITDPAATDAAEPMIRHQLAGRVDGVFHLATEVRFGSIENLEADFTTGMRAKTHGTDVLYRLAARLDARALILFASINGYFGGAGIATYAAANRYQEAFAMAKDGVTGPLVHCLAWSMWDDIGASRGLGLQQLTQRQGFRVLAPGEALAALAEATAYPGNPVYLGLDKTALPIQAELASAPQPLLELVITLPTSAAASPLAALLDPFGTPLLVRVARPSAAVDPPLSTQGKAYLGLAAADLVELIADIWRDVLRLDAAPGPDDDVFELGAHSLATPRVQKAISDLLHVDIDIVELFSLPTPRRLGAHLQELLAKQAGIPGQVAASVARRGPHAADRPPMPEAVQAQVAP